MSHTTPGRTHVEGAMHSAPTSLSRRSLIKAALAAASASVIFGIPNRTYAASASQQTLDALASAEDKLAAVEAELDRLAAEFEALSHEQDLTISKIEDVQAQIDETQAQIDAKQAELEAKQDVLSRRVSNSYKEGGTSILTLLMASESFEELLSNGRYIEKVNDADKQVIGDIQSIRAELEQRKSELEDQKSSLEALKEQQAQQLSDMQAKQAEVQELVAGLSADVKDLIAKRDAEYLAAVAEEERQRQEQQKHQQGAGGSYVPSTGSVSGPVKSLERVLSACHAVPSPGTGLCAMWVSRVFASAGFSYVGGNANDMYNRYCTSSDRSALKPGMIIASPTHPHTAAGRIYGHVGIYVGNNTVMENVGSIQATNLDSWISYYGATVTPRWGWIGGWVLG